MYGCGNSPSSEVLGQPSAVVAALTASKRVMWLGAHPDDENSVSGLLAMAKEMSGTLYLATLNRGENENTRATTAGGQFLSPWGSPPANRGTELGARRAQVFQTLATDLYRADAIDIGPFVNGPLSLAELDALPPTAPHQDWVNETPDVVIAKWDRDVGGNSGAAVAYVVALIRRWRPNTVISWDEWCSGSGHPEHRAAAKLLHDAVRLAANPLFPDSAHPATNVWNVDRVLAAATIIPALVNCGYCKCQGSPPPEPIENVDLHVRSSFFGAEYFDIKCRALSGYANAARDGDLTGAELAAIRANCPAAASLSPTEPVRILLSY